MPRSDRTITPLTTIPDNLSPDLFVRLLNSKIEEINRSFASLDLMESELRGEDGNTAQTGSDIDVQGNRVRNAKDSEKDTDYVTRGELRRNSLYVDHTGSLKTNRPIQTSQNITTTPARSANESVTLSQLQALINQALPAGIIVQWHDTIATIPVGWRFCDGSNGTPDLRDFFLVGAKQDDGGVAKTNVTGALTTTGGSVSYTPAGTISNDSAGTPAGTISAIGATATTGDSVATGADFTVADQTHTHPAPTFTGSALAGHSHTFTGTAAQIIPPYKVAVWIMKI